MRRYVKFLVGLALGVSLAAPLASQPAPGLSRTANRVRALDGTAAAPEVTFVSDLDTGLYWISANILGVTAGGAEVGRFSSAGFTGALVGDTVKVTTNTGFSIEDTDGTHYLTIAPGSNLTAARTLTLTTGDAARTLTLNGNPTLDDWFDQAVKTTSAPTFATVNTGQGAYELYLMNQNVDTAASPSFVAATLTGNLSAEDLLIEDSDASHYLTITTTSNLTAARTLTLVPGDAARTITLSGDTTLADWFDQAVKTTSAPTFATVDTGQGANELYDMDQNVLTTSAVTFLSTTAANLYGSAAANGDITINGTSHATVASAYVYLNTTGRAVVVGDAAALTDIGGDGEGALQLGSAQTNGRGALYITGNNAGGVIADIRGYNVLDDVTAIISTTTASDAANLDFYTQTTGGALTKRFFISTNGLVGFNKQTETVADGGAGATAFNLTPSQSYIEITCNDADGCNATMIETGMVEGTCTKIVNVSAANVVNFADTAGVSEIAGAFAAGAYDAIELCYDGATWYENSRSNN